MDLHHGVAEVFRARDLASGTLLTLPDNTIDVALLTGGRDVPYAYGLATALVSKHVCLDLIAGDELDRPEFTGMRGVTFLNLRGDPRTDASLVTKTSRVLAYYIRLIRYAWTAKPKLFHILWNNKFETIDRTLLMLYYKLLGKKIAYTVHNVNAGTRDSSDTLLNRLTLRIQYRLADHIFVHTERMKGELVEDFGVRQSAITVIPFGINNAVPDTGLTPAEARQRLGIEPGDRTILFFGTIAPYKGLEYLVAAFQQIAAEGGNHRLIIAGRPRKGSEKYWDAIQETIRRGVQPGRILQRIEYISDEETEVYFKAADALILPYTHIFQSGVLFLGYSFGLPVIAAEVGALSEDIVQGQTGFVFAPRDPTDLARVIETYFASDLFQNLNSRRQEIRRYAVERHSWDTVALMTRAVYAELLGCAGLTTHGS
jgi:glycosyltransferase involved in cell wall biosynthesis